MNNRNKPYPCNSGRKYKKCCLPLREVRKTRTILERRKSRMRPRPDYVEDTEHGGMKRMRHTRSLSTAVAMSTIAAA